MEYLLDSAVVVIFSTMLNLIIIYLLVSRLEVREY